MHKHGNLIFTGSLFLMAILEKEKAPQPLPISLFLYLMLQTKLLSAG